MRSSIHSSITETLLIVILTIMFCMASLEAQGKEMSPLEDMVLINPGGFMRGTDKPSGIFKDESPAKMIYLSAYYIDKYEVSNAQYTEFIKATDHAAPAYWDNHQLNRPDQPVTGVNWYDANAYCHWANKRLPTEAEWEKAARGPAGLKYPWGNDLDYSKANFAKGKTGQKHITAPVNAHPEGKSYYGVYNMAGNVFEWVQDWYHPNYYTTSTVTRNPKGPSIDASSGQQETRKKQLAVVKKRVIRGGSWFAPAQSITTTHRFWNDPMNNSYGVGLGFRCARDVETDSSMQARSFYMDALVQMGAQKYKKAMASVNQAIQADPGNKEYKALKAIIKEKGQF